MSSSPSSPSSRSRPKTSCASCSLTRLIAKPTWTMTYSPTCTSGVYARQTSLVTPANDTEPMSIPPGPFTMLSTLPGTPRHMSPPPPDSSRRRHAARRGLVRQAPGGDHRLSQAHAAVVRRHLPVHEHLVPG